MILAISIFCIAYIFIATEWIDKTIVSLLGAAAMVCFGVINYEPALGAVDLNVVFLLVGMMMIVNVFSETGVFEWLSIKISQVTKGRGLLILLSFLVMTAVLSMFLDNVTTVILVAPIMILLAQILEIPIVPALIMSAIFSNIGGVATMIGDPPNILIGSKTSFNFNDFIQNLSPVVLLISVVLLSGIALIFRKKYQTDESARERVKSARPEEAITEPQKLRKALIIFGVVLLGFFFGHQVRLEPGIVAICGAMLMCLICRVEISNALRAVEWNTIFFFIGLFMMIAGLETNGVFQSMGEYMLRLSNNDLLTTAIVILWFSAFASAIIDNIPLVMAMIPLVHGIVPVFAQQLGIENDAAQIRAAIEAPLFWALALGACLGGNGSLIGASANVVIAQIAKRSDYEISFWNFTKYGFPMMLISIIISTIYIWLRYF